jgi:signal transduction histidine kinase
MLQSEQRPLNWLFFLSPLIEYGMILAIFIGTHTGIEGFIFVLFTFRVILMYPIFYGLVITLLGYIGYILIWTWTDSRLYEIIINGFSYSLLVLCILSVKVLLSQRETIIHLNAKLIEQSTSMEKMAMIEERNRIAKDMHNTVGHTLTTAIVSLEGVDVLMDKDRFEAHRRLKIAKDQLKSGLGDIRQVVKQLADDNDAKFESHLKSRIEQIISDIKLKIAIDIEFDYSIDVTLLSLQNYVLYNVVKECITNAIKHTEAKIIRIHIVEQNDIIMTTFINDGVTDHALEEGFGLKIMKESVEAIGGRMTYGFKQRDHFELVAYIPLIQEVLHRD